MSLGDFYDEYFRKLFEEEDYPYINEFHRKHTEACERENERVRSMHFTAEFLRAQTKRMEELVRKQEEKEREQKRLKKQAKNSANKSQE